MSHKRGTIFTSLPDHPLFQATLQPGGKRDEWICSHCQQDKTYTFSYQLKESAGVSWEKSWWCEDCCRRLGLIW